MSERRQPGSSRPPASESIRLVRAPCVPGVDVIDVRDSTRLWQVFHEGYDVCVIPQRQNDPRGVAYWWYRGRVRTAGAGNVMLTEPGELHVTRRIVRPARHYQIVMIPRPLFMDAARELGLHGTPHFALACSDSPALVELLTRFCNAAIGGAGPLEQQALFAESVRMLVTECAEGRDLATPPHDGVHRARDFLIAHRTDHVSLAELAAQSGLSTYHLVHQFTQLFGMPPHAFQTRLRVEAAREQLADGRRPSEADVGFADQSHLTRHFKKSYGITPGEYAAAVTAARLRSRVVC